MPSTTCTTQANRFTPTPVTAGVEPRAAPVVSRDGRRDKGSRNGDPPRGRNARIDVLRPPTLPSRSLDAALPGPGRAKLGVTSGEPVHLAEGCREELVTHRRGVRGRYGMLFERPSIDRRMGRETLDEEVIEKVDDTGRAELEPPARQRSADGARITVDRRRPTLARMSEMAMRDQSRAGHV